MLFIPVDRSASGVGGGSRPCPAARVV